MTRTAPWTLVALGVAGLVVGWLLELFLASTGAAVVVPPYPLAAVLVVLAVAIVAAAIPVRRVARGRPGARVDPFYATRVLALAKAASLSAAVFAGLIGGVLVFVATRPVVSDDQLWKSVAGLAASAALLIGGLVAENMCRVPPPADEHRDDERADGDRRGEHA